jgi:hypothetical protein
MILKSEIQEKLSAVAKGSLSPWDFHVWLEDNSWSMHQGSSEDAIELAGDIKIYFEEYYQGLIDEEQLAENLILLGDSVVVFDYSPYIAQINATPFQWASSSSAVLPMLSKLAQC